MYRCFVKHNYVLLFIHFHGMRLHCFVTVNSSVNAARSSLNSVCRRKFDGKGNKLKTFPKCYVISLCGVVVRYSRVERKVLGSSPTQYLSFFFPFFVLLFSINIQ